MKNLSKSGTKAGLLFFVLCLLLPLQAWPHSGSTAFIEFSSQDNIARGEWLLALRDLERMVGIDANQDGKLTAGEITQRNREMTTYARTQLFAYTPDKEKCTTNLETGAAVILDDVIYWRWPFTIACPDKKIAAELHYTALFAEDASHRAITKWHVPTQKTAQVLIFSPQQQEMELRQTSTTTSQLLSLCGEGVLHILQGYDHLLFLLALLAPAILARPALAVALRHLLGVITAFTAGHSITLAIATLSGWSPPSRLVEIAIAVTVIVAGINIVLPLFRDSSWRIALLFGLVHGFGFASALRDLELAPSQLALSLLGFNLGVETGQLLVIALVMPLAGLLVKKFGAGYKTQLACAFSAVLAGSVWLVERTM
jgi:hypothetical protein